MKTRLGLVSNSSSSSFIIAIARGKSKIAGVEFPNADEILESECCDNPSGDTNITAIGIDNVIEELTTTLEEEMQYIAPDLDDVMYQDNESLIERIRAFDPEQWTIVSLELGQHNQILGFLLELGLAHGRVCIIKGDSEHF